MRLIKQGVTKALSWRVAVGRGRRFIFLFHDVSDPAEPHHSRLYSTSVAAFRAQLEFLARHFDLVALDELLSPERDAGRRPRAAVTFDDGFLSVRETAWPLLRAKGVPFALFVNRAAVTENRLFNDSEGGRLERGGGPKVFLDEEDVRALASAGVEIGSHSATHRRLAECDDETLRDEIDANKLFVERLTGRAARYFALPFGMRGDYNERVIEHCLRAGHEFVFSTNPTSFGPDSESYRRRVIPRIGLTEQTPSEITFLVNRPLVKTIDI